MLRKFISFRAQKYISWGLQAILGITLLISLVRFQWLNALIITGILTATFLTAMIRGRFDKYLPVEIEFFAVIFIFLSLFLGEFHDYYLRFWWWDALLHLCSGILLGTLAFMLIFILNREERVRVYMKPGFVAFFAFTFALSIGAVWEMFEFAMDSWFGTNMQKSGLVDTMWDLIVDALGALIASVSGYLYLTLSPEGDMLQQLTRSIRKRLSMFSKNKAP